MRKLTFLTMIFALLGSAVYGQATKDSAPIPLSGACQDDALHPIAGKSYSYITNVDPSGGNALWWSTKDSQFIQNGTDNSNTKLTVAGGDLVSTTANYGTPITAGASTSVDITWSTDILANTQSGTNPTFVVVKYDAPAGNCSNNLKVYQIDPINAFTVDILNIESDGTTTQTYGTTYSSCVADVENATYSSTVNKVVYEYGENELFYEIVAANFSGSYTPTFQLTGLEDGQEAKIEWGYTKGTYDKTLATGITGASWSQTSTEAVTTNETNTNDGVSIYVKVTVDNGNFETLNKQTIELAVKGENTAGQSDILNNDCNTDATFASNTATQDINPRPDVTNSTTGGTFVPKN